MAKRQAVLYEIEANNEKFLQELETRIATGNSVIPFIGAGMSCPIYGTWSAYLESIPSDTDDEIRDLLQQQLKKGLYDEAAQIIHDSYGMGFYNRTADYFRVSKIKAESISPATKLLPHLFQCPMLTTNLDRVIETVYARENIHLEAFMAGSSHLIQPMARDGVACLWKIHGDIMDRKSWILTRDAYRAQYGSENGKLFQENLRQILAGKVLLFLGCSLESDSIMQVLQDICQNNLDIRHYAILPVKNGYRFNQEDIKGFHSRSRKLESIGIQPIWYPDGDHGHVEQYLQRLLRAKSEPDKKKAMKAASNSA